MRFNANKYQQFNFMQRQMPSFLNWTLWQWRCFLLCDFFFKSHKSNLSNSVQAQLKQRETKKDVSPWSDLNYCNAPNYFIFVSDQRTQIYFISTINIYTVINEYGTKLWRHCRATKHKLPTKKYLIVHTVAIMGSHKTNSN